MFWFKFINVTLLIILLRHSSSFLYFTLLQTESEGQLLKKRVQKYVAQIQQLQDLLFQREKESEELLMEYRNCMKDVVVDYTYDTSAQQYTEQDTENDILSGVSELDETENCISLLAYEDLIYYSGMKRNYEMDCRDKNDESVEESYKHCVSSYIQSKY